MPLQPAVTPDPLRSNDVVKVYQATYRSLDGLDIFGWYSVPAVGDGPFPAILVLPGYKSEPALRRDWGRKGVAVLSVAVRGKLPSNSGVQPRLSGLAYQRHREPGELRVSGRDFRLFAGTGLSVVKAGN